MNFCIITWNKNIEKRRNDVTMQLCSIHKNRRHLLRYWKNTLKQDLILQINVMNKSKKVKKFLDQKYVVI